jgi:hypothetical protein
MSRGEMIAGLVLITLSPRTRSLTAPVPDPFLRYRFKLALRVFAIRILK